MNIDPTITLDSLRSRLDRLFDLARMKVEALNARWNPDDGAPVFTVNGRYATRGWTDWTQGFQYGSAILLFEYTGENRFLNIGRSGTVNAMAGHLTHTGVHDHGFNNISTYGNLLRLMKKGRIEDNVWERRFYELALKVSGAVQASRWTNLPEGLGYVYSFNGPHSLFSDTIRSMRVLGISHVLDHTLKGEGDRTINLLDRAIRHIETTLRYNVYYGDGRDAYDVRGRVVHESIFNLNSGAYRNPSTQQGYSPFSTWTRGHAWILLGLAEQLEFFDFIGDKGWPETVHDLFPQREGFIQRVVESATAVADFYLAETPADGIPYWDTGAPGLAKLGDYKARPADPFNPYEPVDSSAAAIAAQGLLRLGNWLRSRGEAAQGDRYVNAGLNVSSRLFEEPYLSPQPDHEGLILHSIYHRPNGWDYIPPGKTIPSGESTMWGDYHALELGIYLKSLIDSPVPYRFFEVR